MAKTRKGSRKPASSAKGRKKTKKTARSAPRPRARKPAISSRKTVDLNPVKKNLKAHMEQLSQVEDPRVKEALAGLESVQRELTAMCFPTMVISV